MLVLMSSQASAQPSDAIVAVLESGRQDFLAATQGLSDERAATKPGADRWSVLECMEHVITVEGRFLGWLENAGRLEQAEPSKEKEDQLMARITDRSQKAVAPEVVQPTGRVASVAQGLEEFNAIRDKTVQTARELGEELYVRSCKHPRFGDMNGAELIQIIAGHARRHAAQMREARAAVDAMNA